MSDSENYDAIIIGSGQGGTPLSAELAKAGMRTALIERTHIGGTCINEGCSPTKTMVASGRVAYLARRAADYGVHTGKISVDLNKVRERKRSIVDRFRNGTQESLAKTENLELIFGEAKFTGRKTVAVHLKDGQSRSLTATHIFIDAGTRPSRPKLEGLESVPTLDNASLMELDAVPEHLLILGGGYIGLEFGQLFRRFGSRVTIVQSAAQLLVKEDSDVAKAITEILREDGLEILLKAKAVRVGKVGSGVELEIEHEGRSKTLMGSHLLIATGRVPNSDSLNLSAAGVETDDRGFIKVNDRLETTSSGVYAIGDINGEPAFTHISYDDFRILRDNILHQKTATTRGRLVPYTVYIDPQLGRVGLSEGEARDQKRNIQIAKMPMTSVARAFETDETRGFLKVTIDKDTNQILGAAMLAVEGGEMMSAIEIAMMGKLPYTTLREGIFAHPTWMESLNNLFKKMESGN